MYIKPGGHRTCQPMNNPTFFRYLRIFVLCTAACSLAHAYVEYQYYVSCRRTMWTAIVMSASPYCHFLSRTSGAIRQLPVHIVQTMLAPVMLHINT